jgi:hypothetical protein
MSAGGKVSNAFAGGIKIGKNSSSSLPSTRIAEYYTADGTYEEYMYSDTYSTYTYETSWSTYYSGYETTLSEDYYSGEIVRYYNDLYSWASTYESTYHDYDATYDVSAGWNRLDSARFIQNIPVTTETPTNNQAVIFDDTFGMYRPLDIPIIDHDHSGDAGDGGTFAVANLTSGSAADGKILASTGGGGLAWEDWHAQTDVIILTAGDFMSAYGSPSQGSIGDSGWNVGTWRLDDAAAAEGIGAAIEYRGAKSVSTVYLNVWWAMESATTGDIRLGVGATALATGEQAVVSAAAPHYQNFTVPGTAGLVTKSLFSVTETMEQYDLLKIMLFRYGSNVGDTATGDVHILAIGVRII